MRIFLIFLFLSSPALADEFQCQKGAIQTINHGKTLSEEKILCHDEKDHFVSKNCRTESCDVLVALRTHVFQNYKMLTIDSNPSFHLCKEIGMTAFLVNYQISEQLFPSGICLNQKTKNFVSTNYLFKKFSELYAKK